MQQRLVLEFTKMNGAGNDFIVIDNRFYFFSEEELSVLAARFCRRRFSIGADGLLALAAPREPGYDFRMRYFNADGSRATMCGNGARCLARYARLAGLGSEGKLLFETDAGDYRAWVPEDSEGPVRLSMPPPQRFEPEVMPGQKPQGCPMPLHFIWTGTEHAVCFVDSLEAAPVDAWGRVLRQDDAFAPAGANVNFVEVAARGDQGVAKVRARTYEKGVEGETLACGTGALASAVVARLTGRVIQNTIEVEMPGGTLQVGFTLDEGHVEALYLEGPANVVYRGSVEV